MKIPKNLNLPIEKLIYGSDWFGEFIDYISANKIFLEIF